MNSRLRIMCMALFIAVLLGNTFSSKALAQSDDISVLVWSPDGDRLAAGTGNGTVYIFDAASSKVLLTLLNHSLWITSLAWSPDGKRLAGASSDKSVSIWDTTTGKLLFTLFGHESIIGVVFWSKDGSRLISVDPGGDGPIESFKVWNPLTGKLIDSHSEPWIYQMIWNADKTKLVVLRSLGTLIEIRDGTKFGTIKYIEDSDPQPEEVYIASADWSPDSQRIATGTTNGNVRIWDVATGKVLMDIPPVVDAPPVGSLHFNADGSKLFVLRQGQIQVWDAANGKMLGAQPLKNGLMGSGWSTYGARLAQVGKSRAGFTVKVSIPLASVDELRALVKRCATADIQPQLEAKLNAKQLPAFTDQIKQLTRDQMPPACAADILAVAEALQSTS